MDELKPIIEALIFASPEPLTPKMLFKLLESEPKEDVEAALASLRKDYERPGGLQMVEVAGGYQIVTRPELHEWVSVDYHAEDLDQDGTWDNLTLVIEKHRVESP